MQSNKWRVFVLIFVLIVSLLVACGNDDNNSSTSSDQVFEHDSYYLRYPDNWVFSDSIEIPFFSTSEEAIQVVRLFRLPKLLMPSGEALLTFYFESTETFEGDTLVTEAENFESSLLTHIYETTEISSLNLDDKEIITLFATNENHELMLYYWQINQDVFLIGRGFTAAGEFADFKTIFEDILTSLTISDESALFPAE